MRFSGKVLALFFLTSSIFLILLTVYVIQREYQSRHDTLVAQSTATIFSRPDLQMEIYRRDEANLSVILRDFLQSPAISRATVYDNLGKLMSSRSASPADQSAPPALVTLRGKATASETILAAADGEPDRAGFWFSALGDRKRVHLNTPVFTAVNPTQRDLTVDDFGRAIMRPEAANSRVVIGYVDLELEQQQLLRGLAASIGGVLLVFVVMIVLSGLAVAFFMRRIMQPLNALKAAAAQMARGESAGHLEVEDKSEFREIIQLYNSLNERADRDQVKIDVDRKLLTMKVDESASKLSERDLELSKAEEEISAARNSLQKLAYYDTLTSLPNRTLFSEQLRLLLPMSERDGRPLALLYLNLNQFKRINDSLGRGAGDALLTAVAKRLTGCLRSSDMLAHYSGSGSRIDVSRLGGDEFCVVLNQLDNAASAGLVAQRIIETVSRPVSVEGHELVVTPTIGIALAPLHGSDVDDLLRAASTAMHKAKESRKGDFLFYKDEMDAGGLDNFKLEAELRQAIEREQFVLHYQPQVDTIDGSITGAEALLRWEHPDYGQVPPFRFIPMAEQIGMMDELGNWVLLEACRQLQTFLQEGLELPRIAINVSRLQFGTAFTKRVVEVLAQTELPASMLELGLSEEILINDDSDTIRSLRELSTMGVYLAIDNFGTTHAPLSYLSQYPFNEIKIDRSFVSDCDTRTSNGNLVRAIIAMAASLDLHTVAEGVETPGEFQFLADNGARSMQGYLFSKPVPAQLLREQLVVPWHYMTQIQRMQLMQNVSDFSQ